MCINLSEELLSLSAAAKSLPGRPHVSTLCRWHRRGVRGVLLETIVIAGRRYTSAESLQRFAERSTAVTDGEPGTTRSPFQSRQSAATERAVQMACDAAGL